MTLTVQFATAPGTAAFREFADVQALAAEDSRRVDALIRTRLDSQVLLVNAILTGIVAVIAALAFDLGDSRLAGVLALFVIAAMLSTVLNLVLLSNRFGPLEQLIEDMEKVDLSRPGANLPESIDGTGETEEIERIELAFLRMMRRLEAERRRASSAALRAQEQERARVARDLHDEVNQSLTGLLLRLEAARRDAPPELAAELDETKALANRAMRELLTLARQLRPTALDDLGLEAAIAGLVEQVDAGTATATLVIEPDEQGATLAELPAEAQLVLYRVAQEALTNAARHSEAEQIEVRIRPRLAPNGSHGAELTVSDDGIGFAFAEADAGLGLGGMRERALLVDGDLAIESRPQHGTRVHLTI